MNFFSFVMILLGCTFGLAEQAVFYRDEQTGFEMQIPHGIQKRWKLSNSEDGIEFNLFHTALEEEKTCLILTTRIPLKSIMGEGLESLYPALFEQFKDALIQEVNEIGLHLEFFHLPSLADPDYCAQRYRVAIQIEDFTAYLDLHSFLQDVYSYMVMTVVYPFDQQENLDAFTQTVLSHIHWMSHKEGL